MNEVSITSGPSVNVDLTGHSALVTGAASGIGRACAERLSRAGAAVTVLDLEGDAAREVAEGIGGEAMQADLSDYEVLNGLEVDADIVVNNAGLQYVAAKHGLEGFSKTVALEGGAKGVTSNCICPAYVRTPLVENQISDQARTHGISEDEVVEKIMLTEPAIKRLIEPEEVAEFAAFLCTPEASFINGASLVMDGGATVH